MKTKSFYVLLTSQNCLKEDFEKKLKTKEGKQCNGNRCIMFSKVNVYGEEKKSQNSRPAGLEDGARIFKLFRSPRIDQGINSARMCSLAGRYDNPVPYSVPSPHRLFTNSSTDLSKPL
jgi:hypothetical protein